MNKADIDRLISIEADRIRVCAARFIALYPPQPTDDHSLDNYVAKDTTGNDTVFHLGLSVDAIERLLGIAKDYAAFIK